MESLLSEIKENEHGDVTLISEVLNGSTGNDSDSYDYDDYLDDFYDFMDDYYNFTDDYSGTNATEGFQALTPQKSETNDSAVLLKELLTSSSSFNSLLIDDDSFWHSVSKESTAFLALNFGAGPEGN